LTYSVGWGGKLAKIGLESGSMTPWLVRELAKVGFPVMCMDVRAAADAVKSPAGEIEQGGCLCAGRDAADWVVPRGVCKVARQSPAEGHAGGARSVGASQTCASGGAGSVPGVGPIVALAFMAAIEDINRFRRMRSVGAYLGLTTRRYQSSGTDVVLGTSPCREIASHLGTRLLPVCRVAAILY